MSKFSKVLLVLTCFLMIGVVVACSQSSGVEQQSEGENQDGISSSAGSSDSQEPIELIFSNTNDMSHPTNQAAEWMAEELEKRTDGRVTLRVAAGGALGGVNELMSGLETGDVDIAWISSGNFARYVEEAGLLSIAYIIDDKDHYARVANTDSEFMKELSKLVDEADVGSRLVGMMCGSPRREFNSVREVNTPADLEGLMIRIQDSPVEAKVWSALGAQVTPVAWTEVYAALQTKVIDGGETSTSSYLSSKVYEVAPYHNLTDHQFSFCFMQMSDKTYNELPADLQDTVLEIMSEGAEMSWKIYYDAEEEMFAELEAAGVTINEVDTSLFQEKIEEIRDEIVDELGVDDKLLELIDLERQ